MRPLFAIAPLALTLALLGPSSQASPTEPSWVRAVFAWVFDGGGSDGPGRAADGDQRQATFQSTMESR